MSGSGLTEEFTKDNELALLVFCDYRFNGAFKSQNNSNVAIQCTGRCPLNLEYAQNPCYFLFIVFFKKAV